MTTKDIGFDKYNALIFSTPWSSSHEKRQLLLTQLKEIPEIEKISLSSHAPASNGTNTSPVLHTKNKQKIEHNVFHKFIDDQYIDFYKLRILTGKSHIKSDSSAELIVNETFLRNFQLGTPKEAVGKFVTWNDQLHTIVGVVADFHIMSLHQAIPSVAISRNKHRSIFHIKAINKSVIEKAKKLWQKQYPDHLFDYRYVDEEVDKFYKKEANLSVLLGFSMCLAIFISCIGLLGLVIFTTNQRTKEIGIRKIHGASIQQIIYLLVKDFLWLILMAFVVASALAYYIGNKWLENYAYKIDISWWMFILTGGLACVIALFTISFQTFKVAKGNPIKALRME